MKLTRRFLALLLAFSMSLSMVTPAFASEVETVAETEAEAVVEEIAEVAAEAVNETETAATDASTEASEESTEGSDETTEASAEATTVATEETEPVGSEANPEFVEFAMNVTYSEGTATVTVPANTTYYFQSYNVGGMMLSINGVEQGILVGNPRVPAIFSVTNNSEEAAEFVLTVSHPAGSRMNPAALAEGETTVSIEAGSQGYYLTYVAEDDGMLTFEIAAAEGMGWTYVINNLTSGIYGDTQWSDSDPVVNPAETIVAAGDELSIVVNTYDPADQWNNPAGELTLKASFEVAGVSEQNPRNVIFEMNDAYTEGTATVTVPANTTYYFQSFGIGGMEMTIDGVEYGTLMGNPRMPVIFTVTNETDAEAAFEVVVYHLPGSQMNPAELTDGETTVSVEANTQGYYFTYTAADTGVMTMGIAAEPGWTYVINNLTTGKYGDTQWNDSDPVVNPAVIDVAKGDELQIIVNTYDPADMWNVPAGDITLTVSFEAAVGSESNPVSVEFAMNDDYSEGTATVTVPANSTYYFQSFGIGGMMLSVNGVEQGILVGKPRVPAVFGVTNDTDAEAEFALKVYHPVGSQMKPAELADGETTVTVASGTQGYYFTYTAADRGVVTMGIAAEPGWTYVVNNLTSGKYGDIQWNDSDPVVNPAEINVNKGDELSIIVNTYDAATPWDAPAGDITLNVAFEAAYGSESNPIRPEWEMDENNEINYTVTVPANTTNYYRAYGINGMLMSINGGELVEMVAQGMGKVPVYFTITNDTDAEAEYVLHLEYPVGNTMNPADLLVYVEGESYDDADGQNVVHAKEGDWNGYNYTWIAPADGELTITMSNGKAGWFYVINNMSSYIYGDNHYSSNGHPASETVTVSAGDEIAISVNSCGASEFEIPAGDVFFYAHFTETVGIEANPYQPTYYEFQWNDNGSEGTLEITVAANTTYYVGLTFNNMLLTINEEAPVVITGNSYEPDVYTLVNDTDEDMVFTLKMTYPAGSMENPAELTLGSNSAEIEANSWSGYMFRWIAEDRGELTITMDETVESWSYAVNNMTTYQYGETYASNDAEVVSEQVYSVNKGDVIEIQVNTAYDYDSWYSPAGTVTFTAAFEAGEATESNPAFPEFHWNDAQTEAYATVMAPVGTSYYAVYASGMYMTINGGEPFAVNGSRWAPFVFSITNDGEEEAQYDLYMYYLPGSMSNPAEMVLGKKNTAEIEAGNDQGYFFSWVATGNGVLEVAMNTSKNWTYQVAKLVDSEWGPMPVSNDQRWSDDSPLVKKDYIAVTKGETVQIMVNTYDPADMWSNPAGKIEFTPKLIVSYTNTLLAGKNMTLKYLDAAGKTVSAGKIDWTIATADGSEVPATITLKAGKLTADKSITEPVEVIVTGTYEGVAQQFNVTIRPAASSVTIKHNGEAVDSKTTLTLITNKRETWPVLTAEVASEYALGEVTWKSSSTKVVNVVDGVITPAGNKGTATITATAADGSGKKATVKINVTTEVTRIDVTSKTGVYTVGAGKSLTMVATTNKDAVNQKVKWSMMMVDEAVDFEVPVAPYFATLTSTGKLTAAKDLTEAYDIHVYAEALDGSGTVGDCWVTVVPLANSVVINDAPATIDVSDWPYAYLGADVLDAEGNVISNDVTWKSSSEKIAVVDEYGNVEFLKAGKVTITATAIDGSNKKATATITAVKSPWMIEMPAEAILAAGKTLTLKPNVLDADASNKKLNWNLYLAEMTEYGPDFVYDENYERIPVDSSIATLKNGKLAAAKKLDEIVMVAAVAEAQLGGAEGTCFVTLFPGVTKTVSIMSNGAAVGKSVDLYSGKQIVLYAEADAEMAANVYTWKSSDERIATIEQNPDGSVTVYAHALKNGKVTITATAADGTGKKATVTLNVKVNAVALEMDRQYVVAGKSIDLSKKIRFLDENGDVITPANTTIKWSLWERSLIVDEKGEPVLSPDGWPCYEWNPAEDNKCAAGTLNAKTGKFTANKVTDWDVVIINVEYINDEGEVIGFQQGAPVEIYPHAIKGITLGGYEGEFDADAYIPLDKKSITTTTDKVILDPIITNWSDSVCWTFDVTVDNDAFTVSYEAVDCWYYDENGNRVDTEGWFYVIRPVDEANPYGTVKVTVKAVDGSNKSSTCTITFAAE